MLRSRVVEVVWFLLLVGGSSAYCVTAAAELGATFDEPFYLATGLDCWRSGSYRPLMTKGTMPLPVDVQTLPLYLTEQRRGEAFANPYGSMPELLPVARAMNLPFWWLLLFYGLRWGRELGGVWAGRLACGLLAVEPNLLAHAMLATTDIALTGTVLAAGFHWHVGRDKGWVRRLLVPGIWYGVALASKASALAFVPIIWFVLGMWHVYQTQPFAWRSTWSATRRLRWDLVSALSIGCVVVFAYCGCDWEPEPTFVAWAHQQPDGALRSVMVPVSENLPIFTNAGEGLMQQVKHNFRGHGAYVLGEYHSRAVWYYYPVALATKLPEAVLILFGLLLLTRSRALLNPVGWVVLALLLFSLNARVQIGVRLVFPLVAFWVIAMVVAVRRQPLPRPLPEAGRGERHLSDSGSPSPLRGGGWGEGLLRLLSVLVLLGTLATSAWVWPDPLRHVNRFWGGSDRGYEVLADSNYDWGQGLPELKAWWATNQEPRLHVWYYGADPAILMTPFRLLEVHRMANATPETVTTAVGDGYLAVSLSLLYASPDRKPETLVIVTWLRSRDPVARTRTFVIYKL